MSPSESEMDDLKKLKREAEELRKKRQGKGSASGSSEDSAKAQAAEADSEEGDELSELELEAEGLTAHIDNLLKEVEVLARKHPSLALAAAFSAGFMAGNILPRR